MTITTMEQHEVLMQSLMDPARWPAGGGDRRRIDTHISTVILAGDLAYKIKKPLDLGFLDFLGIDARRHACEEELRLNGRLAPQIYRAVCALTGSIANPEIDGAGEVIDWAVQMRRFDPDAILSNLMQRIDADLIERLAERVAAFHGATAVCDPRQDHGSPASVYAPMEQNLLQIPELCPAFAQPIEALAEWSAAERERLAQRLRERQSHGHIRECHGDLHLRNVALIAGEPVVFDAIEFNPGLRWIDTVNDIAFLTMDLRERGRTDLAQRFLNRYLQRSGDYEGLALLRFYEVYRALVRAKIAAIRSRQADLDPAGRTAVEDELAAYIGFAGRLIEPRQGALLITMGVSGSGKSRVARTLPDSLPAVCLRSDVERKRIVGVDAHTDATLHGAYSGELTEATYARLLQLARGVIGAGYVAVIDATFLEAARRTVFAGLAAELGVAFAIIDCDAPVAVLRDRISARRHKPDNVSDADLSVLERQLQARDPLSPAEQRCSIAVRPGQPLDHRRLAGLLQVRTIDRADGSDA